MVILGLVYNFTYNIYAMDPAKFEKYSKRMHLILNRGWASSKDLERIIGNLAFAAVTVRLPHYVSSLLTLSPSS